MNPEYQISLKTKEKENMTRLKKEINLNKYESTGIIMVIQSNKIKILE